MRLAGLAPLVEHFLDSILISSAESANRLGPDRSGDRRSVCLVARRVRPSEVPLLLPVQRFQTKQIEVSKGVRELSHRRASKASVSSRSQKRRRASIATY